MITADPSATAAGDIKRRQMKVIRSYLLVLALFGGVIFTSLATRDAFAQTLRTVGSLTIPTVIDSPVPVYSAGVSYTRPAEAVGGGSQNQLTFSVFKLTKLIDPISPILLVNAASGTVFPQAKIDIFQADATLITSYELSNIVVLSVNVESAPSAEFSTLLVEEISLGYEKIKQTVSTPSGPVTGCWDTVQDVAC